MHATIQLLIYWALAFVSLSAALTLLNIFDSFIGNDLFLHSLGKEAVIAGFAALVEGGCLWLVVTYVPTAGRALAIPAVIVALIYKIAHLEDWSKGDGLMLLMFQLALGLFAGFLIVGQFQIAFIILIVFAGLLGLAASFFRNL